LAPAVAVAIGAALLLSAISPAGPASAQDELACDAEPVVMTTADGVDFVRTPDACFDDLPDWPYEPDHVEIDGLRQAYVDAGPADGEVVLLLHGQPSWSYLYRDMIPVLADAGYRVIAMDHLGMGRSDKPVDIESYSYLGHNERLQTFVEELELTDINLFVQDWGSLVGLRVAGLDPDRYATIAVGDGALPVIPAGFVPFPPVEDPDVLTDLEFTGAQIPPQQVPFYDGCEPILDTDPGYFGDWMAYAMTAESFMPSVVVEAMTWFDLPPEEEAAYDAPFPSRIYMAGPRTFPSLINDVPGTTAEAWAGLTAFEKPFLTLWASNDPGNLGSCEVQQNFIDNVPGAAGQPHDRLPEASHFLQDDQGTEIATRLVAWFGSLDGGSVAAEEAVAGPVDVAAAADERAVGFEIMEITDDGIKAWLSSGLTQEEFEAIDLPAGWFKNQPREAVADGARFYGSPGADGVDVEAEHFGHEWFHSATVVGMGQQLDDEGLLTASTVEKDHEISFGPGATVTLLVSPDDERYVLVSRDADRTSDEPTIPPGWELVEEPAPDGVTFRLDGQTRVIRADNEDSFQGPVMEAAP
jgi:pimeloyl-ACP methyl ester carboxylesterase